ncbi:MAG: rhodanese family protein [Sphingomonas bacterium]|nr:rhodanese family protein [Sphingomonas bacterium]
MTVKTIAPHAAADLLKNGAQLIDIRGADEHARERIGAASNVPLDRLAPIDGDIPLIFHCRSGQRTKANADKLATVNAGPTYLLEGGIDGWKAAGLPTLANAKQPLELMRQVQIGGGAMVLLSVLLGWLVSPAFLLLGGAVGIGMLHAGITGSCAMTALLAPMPWNRGVAGV